MAQVASCQPLISEAQAWYHMASVADKVTLGRFFSTMVFPSVSLTNTPYLHSYMSLIYYWQ